MLRDGIDFEGGGRQSRGPHRKPRRSSKSAMPAVQALDWLNVDREYDDIEALIRHATTAFRECQLSEAKHALRQAEILLRRRVALDQLGQRMELED